MCKTMKVLALEVLESTRNIWDGSLEWLFERLFLETDVSIFTEDAEDDKYRLVFYFLTHTHS